MTKSKVQNIVSMREIQRNYKRLFDKVRKTKTPLFLGSYAEAKVVSCLKGEIFDVAVDLRQGSPTFLRWHGEILSAGNHRSMLIREGFAHGFQTLSEDCELIYLHFAPFHSEAEGAFHVRDSKLAIAWPLTITELSDRDRAHPLIAADFSGIDLS